MIHATIQPFRTNFNIYFIFPSLYEVSVAGLDRSPSHGLQACTGLTPAQPPWPHSQFCSKGFIGSFTSFLKPFIAMKYLVTIFYRCSFYNSAFSIRRSDNFLAKKNYNLVDHLHRRQVRDDVAEMKFGKNFLLGK